MDLCDESKCVSRGMSDDLYDGSFTCYGNDDIGPYPMMCADVYIPRMIEDESPQTYLDDQNDDEIPLWYYTCCPPDQALEIQDAAPLLRHCSDPIVVLDPPSETNGNRDYCYFGTDSDQRIYPRQMESREDLVDNEYTPIADSIMCCDSELAINDSINATVAECVPYRDDFSYDAALRNNSFFLEKFDCSDNWGHPYPYLLAEDNIVSSGRYQCCQTLDPDTTLYVYDSAEMYTYLAIYGIAALASAIVFIGLTIPLFLEWKNKRSGNRSRRGRQSVRARRNSGGETSYSTYNLYMVFLAFTDLFLSLTRLPAAVNVLLQKDFEDNLADVYFGFWFIANFSINAMLCNEVFVLLRNTQKRRRIDPPSLKRVNIQALAAYLLGAIIAVTMYFTEFGFSLLLVVSVLLTTYIFAVTAVVWRRGYLRTTRDGTTVADRGTRVLAVFFFRFVWITVIFLLPGAALSPDLGDLGFSDDMTPTTFAFYLLSGLGPIATACCILTKPDCRKYIVKLVTLFYCTGFDCNKRGTANRTTKSKGSTLFTGSNHTGRSIFNGSNHTGRSIFNGNNSFNPSKPFNGNKSFNSSTPSLGALPESIEINTPNRGNANESAIEPNNESLSEFWDAKAAGQLAEEKEREMSTIMEKDNSMKSKESSKSKDKKSTSMEKDNSMKSTRSSKSKDKKSTSMEKDNSMKSTRSSNDNERNNPTEDNNSERSRNSQEVWINNCNGNDDAVASADADPGKLSMEDGTNNDDEERNDP